MKTFIKTSEQLRKEFAQAHVPVFRRKDVDVAIVPVAIVPVAVSAPANKKRSFKDVLAVAAVTIGITVGTLFTVSQLLPPLSGTEQAAICYGCNEEGFNSAYDAIVALNPDASSKQVSALLKDFESINSVRDADHIPTGVYEIPVSK